MHVFILSYVFIAHLNDTYWDKRLKRLNQRIHGMAFVVAVDSRVNCYDSYLPGGGGGCIRGSWVLDFLGCQILDF